MKNEATPQETMSAGALVRASIAAGVLAVVVLVTVILPAEYDIDPTGLGEKLGLTVFSAPTGATTPNVQQSASNDQAPRMIEVTVPSGKGIEYKFRMSRYAKMTYEWASDGQPLYLDLHGEPEGDTTGYFESYVEASASGMKGSFTAPFDGSHGWYWRNDTDADISVRLQVAGQFDVIGLK